jgi:dihydrolipoamide dehydrogenase
VDAGRAVQYKNDVVKILTNGVAGLLKSNGVKVYKGTGTITRDKGVLVGGEKLTAKKIILAGGSKAAKIRIPGIESRLVLTSDEILYLKEVPESVAVIGGGVIGVEMAMVLVSYGCRVTIVEVMDRLVPAMDRDISRELKKALTGLGVEVLTGRKLERIEEKGNRLTLLLDGGQTVEADKALLSIGRVPDLDGLGEIELERNARGGIMVNEKMETSVEGIYAPGDINGKIMLAHAAFKMGETAAVNAMGGDEKVNLQYVPSCIYTLPEIGAVGLTEEAAREKYDISVGRFPFAANGRALAAGEAAGFVKIVTDRKYGEVLGVHIIGPGAAETINEAAALMNMEVTADEIADIIHGHPTYSEAFMEAAADSVGRSVHLPKR